MFAVISVNLRRGLPVVVAAALACIALEARAGGGPLDASGTAPSEADLTELQSTLCDRDAAPEICRCDAPESSSPTIGRLYSGAFTGADAPEMLAAVEYCGRRSAALFARDHADGQSDAADAEGWQLREVFAGAHIETCTIVDPEAGTDILVCHRALDGGTWRVGLFHSLHFTGGRLERRQLTSYKSNARGCPPQVLRTEHPTGWRVWQVADDPRPPLLTIFFEHQNGRVPDRFADACAAMRSGEPVFGRTRRVVEYFELVDGRLEFAGATRRSQGQQTAEWSTDRRLEAPVCRRRDILEHIRDRREAIRECYARTGDRREATGRIEVRWTIERDGRVGRTAIVSDTVDRPELAECLRQTVSEMTFTPPRGGDRCTFVYPFDFSSDS